MDPKEFAARWKDGTTEALNAASNAPGAGKSMPFTEGMYAGLLAAQMKGFLLACEYLLERVDERLAKAGMAEIPRAEFEAIADRVVEAMKGYVTKQTHGAMFFQGPYDANGKYIAGDVVQRKGTIWLALDDNPQGLPGETASWRQLVKPQ